MPRTAIIDCERHVKIDSLDALLPYVLDDAWRHNWTTGEFDVPPPDAHPGVQIEAGSGERETARQVADALGEDVEIALLSSPQALQTTSGMANAGYAFGTILAVQLAVRLRPRRLLLLYSVTLVIASVLTAPIDLGMVKVARA